MFNSKYSAMKTSISKKAVTVFLILLFVSGFSFPAFTSTNSSINNPEETSDLKSIIQHHVEYPEYAKEHSLSGFVLVAVTVNNEGKITVTESYSNSDYLKEYVTGKLQELIVDNPGENVGKTTYYRFNFKKQSY